MQEHEYELVKINNEEIKIDKEMVGIIKGLNHIGFKTSGCCIGDKYAEDDSAWIKIQETDRYKIYSLMKNLKDCEYIIEKELYLKDNIVYMDYVLSIPKGSYQSRINKLNKWVEALWNYEEIQESFHVATIEDLFDRKED